MGTSITIRDIDEMAVVWITRKAKQEGLSLEDAVVQLIHESIESEGRVSKLKRYNDLASLAGTWSDEESEEFLKAIADFSEVD